MCQLRKAICVIICTVHTHYNLPIILIRNGDSEQKMRIQGKGDDKRSRREVDGD